MNSRLGTDMKDRYESGDLARERDEQEKQMDAHDIVDQIDVVIRGHEDSIKLLKTLRRDIAKDRKFKWVESVNGWGNLVKMRIPVREKP